MRQSPSQPHTPHSPLVNIRPATKRTRTKKCALPPNVFLFFYFTQDVRSRVLAPSPSLALFHPSRPLLLHRTTVPSTVVVFSTSEPPVRTNEACAHTSHSSQTPPSYSSQKKKKTSATVENNVMMRAWIFFLLFFPSGAGVGQRGTVGELGTWRAT